MVAKSIATRGLRPLWRAACKRYRLRCHSHWSYHQFTRHLYASSWSERRYTHIKKDLCLSSISGGTDIISCFAGGNPISDVYAGQLQARGLGMAVNVWNENGASVIAEKGELVCTRPFPSMPIYFYNDSDQKKIPWNLRRGLSQRLAPWRLLRDHQRRWNDHLRPFRRHSYP